MSNIDQYNPDEIKKILYSYNLLDDFYIDQDLPTSTAAIFVAPIDADITISKADKEMAKRLLLMQTAVDKIWKGYASAFDKESYKKQFDIYPLKDFDEHMASLGAIRSNDLRDFNPAEGAEIIDWVAVIDKEREERSAEFKKQQDEIKKKKLEEDVEKSKEIKTKQDDLEKNNDGGKTGPKKQEDINKEKEKADLDNESIDQLSKLSTKQLREKLKELQKQQAENPNSTENDKNTREIKDILAKIKQAEAEIDDTLKGNKIDPRKQKFITDNMETNSWTVKTNKNYSGFTTQGPFCLQKRNYFRNIFRPSIQHFDTEFRETSPYDPFTSKDEQTSKTLKAIKMQKGSIKLPEKVDAVVPNEAVTSAMDGNDKITSYYELLPPETKKLLNELDMAIQNLYLELYAAYYSQKTNWVIYANRTLLEGIFSNQEQQPKYISKIVMYGLIGYSSSGKVSGVELKSVQDAAGIVYSVALEVYKSKIDKQLEIVKSIAGKTDFQVKEFFKGL